MTSSRPTIYDVAREAGVSKSLVSLVLRGSPSVSDASRAAVDAAIHRLNYRPSRAAADLAARSTMLIGLLIDDYANPWFIDLARGLHETLSPLGYRLSVTDVATASPHEDPAEGLLSLRADGIVVGMDMPRVLTGSAGPPLVVAGTREPQPTTVDSVANDDQAGGVLAARHLRELGHLHLGQISAAGGAARARRESFLSSVAADGAVSRFAIDPGPPTEEAGRRLALALLGAHPEVTAIFAANDLMALGVLGAARSLGLRVPEDLSVVGYDNTELAAATLIDLTTIDDDSRTVGREAGRLLALRIDDSDRPIERVSLAPSLVRRGTTAPVRA